MSVPCTKELLLCLIEDIELISRELIENSVAPKQNRMAAPDHKVGIGTDYSFQLIFG